MRILHAIPAIAPRYGGPSVMIGPLCAALNQIPGLSVELLTTDADGAGARLSRSAAPDGLDTHMCGVSMSERWKCSSELWKWVRCHARNYDLIHVHALWSFTTAAVSAAARRAGVPYLLRPAGMLSDYTWSRVPYRKRLYWAAIERRNVYGAAGFHATSVGEVREIDASRPGAKIYVAPNGVDDMAWATPTDSHTLRRLCGPLAGNRPIILFMSRLHPKKGITDVLLPALAQIKSDAFLAIAGNNDEHAPGYAAEIEHQVQRLKLGERVAMLGPISAEMRWSLYDAASVFVLPSHSENFGIVVTEAMARGCPVVVSKNAFACEHVELARAGRVVSLDVPELADAIDEMLRDSALRDEMGSSGREYARTNLGWDRIAAQVADMYHDCLDRPTVSEENVVCHP